MIKTYNTLVKKINKNGCPGIGIAFESVLKIICEAVNTNVTEMKIDKNMSALKA